MSTEEKKDDETKDIEYNEEQKIIEESEGHVDKIKEINDITIGENEKLVDIKERLVPIPERIRNLRNELLKQLDELKEKLKQVQDEVANDKTLENIVNLIKTSIEKIDDLSKETATLNTTKDEINDAIDKKVEEAREKELEGKDEGTKDSAKKNDEIAFKTDDNNKLQQIWDDLVTKAKQDKENNDNVAVEILDDDQDIGRIYNQGTGDAETFNIVNKISKLIKKQTPLIYEKMKENIKDKYENDPKGITLAEIETLYKKSNTEVSADPEIQDIFKRESGEFKEIVNKVSKQFQRSPVLYDRFKKELVEEYKEMENKGKLTTKIWKN